MGRSRTVSTNNFLFHHVCLCVYVCAVFFFYFCDRDSMVRVLFMIVPSTSLRIHLFCIPFWVKDFSIWSLFDEIFFFLQNFAYHNLFTNRFFVVFSLCHTICSQTHQSFHFNVCGATKTVVSYMSVSYSVCLSLLLLRLLLLPLLSKCIKTNDVVAINFVAAVTSAVHNRNHSLNITRINTHTHAHSFSFSVTLILG